MDVYTVTLETTTTYQVTLTAHDEQGACDNARYEVEHASPDDLGALVIGETGPYVTKVHY